MMASAQTESSTEVTSAQMEKDHKTEEDRATIIRNKEKRKFVDFIGGCLHGRFQEHDFSRRFRNYSLPRQSLWITMAVCLTIVAVYLQSNVVQHRLHQKTTVHSEITTEKTVPFPAVTICSQEPFQKNKLRLYQSQTASTPSTNPINDFDAVWEIYELEEALKLHAEQPSCEDNISNVECSLKPAQCSKNEDSNLQTGMPNFRKIRRQRNLENSVLSNIDLSLSSPMLNHFPSPILKPRSISSSPTSSFSQLLKDFIVNNFGNLVNMCYGNRLSAESTWKFVMDCFDDPVCSDKVSLYTFLSLTWIDDEIIAYFSEIVDNFSSPDMIHDYATDSSDHEMIAYLYGDYSAYSNDDMLHVSYTTRSYQWSMFLDTLYFYYEDYTYYEIMAFLYGSGSSINAYEWSMYLDTLYYLFPGYTYHEIIEHLSAWYSAYSYDVQLYDSWTYSSGWSLFSDTFFLYYAGYTYFELMEDLYSSDSLTNAFGWSMHLDTLYHYFPDYTYYEIMEHLYGSDSFANAYDWSMHLDTLYHYFPDYTYHEIIELLSGSYNADSTTDDMLDDSSSILDLLDEYSTLTFGLQDHVFMLYYYFPDYTYTEIIEYFLLYAPAATPDSSINNYGWGNYLHTLYLYFPDYTYYEIIEVLGYFDTYTPPEDTQHNSFGFSMSLEALYNYFPGQTYNEIMDFLAVLYGSSNRQGRLYDYYEWETRYKVLDRERALGYDDTLQAMYSLYPEYSFTAIMDLLTNEACAVLPDLTYNSETQALQEGHALHQEYEEEMDMLRMLVFGSPFEDPMDLMQWSSISTRQIEEFGFTYSELISDCSYNGETCDQSDFTKWSNDRYGNCFTFNSQFNSETKPREASQPGKQNGLKLVLNTMEEGPSGYRISVHHPAEVPMPEENGIEISAEKTSVLSTSAQLHERITEPRGTCKEIEWTLDGSQTLDGCKKVCQEEMIRLNCKCKKIMLEMKEDIEEQLPECSSRNMQCMRDVTKQYNRDSCSHCFAPCQEITYKTEVSKIGSLQTNGRCIDDLTMEPNEYLKTSVSVIHVYLENLQIEKLREIPSYSLYNAVLETGIWIYFFLGLSMLALLAFIFELLLMLASGNNNPINEEKTVSIKYMSKGL